MFNKNWNEVEFIEKYSFCCHFFFCHAHTFYRTIQYRRARYFPTAEGLTAVPEGLEQCVLLPQIYASIRVKLIFCYTEYYFHNFVLNLKLQHQIYGTVKRVLPCCCHGDRGRFWAGGRFTGGCGGMGWAGPSDGTGRAQVRPPALIGQLPVTLLVWNANENSCLCSPLLSLRSLTPAGYYVQSGFRNGVEYL